MPFQPFTCPVVRRIWGSPDAILFIFIGSGSEFAASKAVDWLFFTNVLPAAPVDRLFETARFAQRLIFGTSTEVAKTIGTINRIHRQVEAVRGFSIPEWAYRDVLFFLIDYGERAHAIVYGPMSEADRIAHFEAMLALGHALHLRGLPKTYTEYQAQRHQQLLEDYSYSRLTDRLFDSYRAAIGPWRFWLFRLVQAALLPAELRPILGLRPNLLMEVVLHYYCHIPGGGNKLRWLIYLLLPWRNAEQIRMLVQAPGVV